MGTAENRRKANKPRFKLWITLTALITGILMFAAGFFTFYLICGKTALSVGWAIKYIDRYGYYYDEKTGEIKSFTADDYVSAITAELLDRYSDFYTKEEYSDVISTSRGNNYGVGISIKTSEGKAAVYSVTGNSPAEKAGMRRGDEIVGGEVEGIKKTFSSSNEVFLFLDGICKEEEFTLNCKREGENIDFTLKKSVYIASFVEYKDGEKSLAFSSEGSAPLSEVIGEDGLPELGGDAAYILLRSFNGGAASQMEKALKYMTEERGKTKLILDLRYNGGGYMTVLSDIAALLLYDENDKTPVIAVAKYKNGKTDVFRSSGDKFSRTIESIAVLANDGTASASECLIGAMKYYGKGFDESKLVITENDKGVARTYGKGIMQTTFQNYLTGEAVKLTTAYIYQPDEKTSIHGKGFVSSGENAVKGDAAALARAIEILKS